MELEHIDSQSPQGLLKSFFNLSEAFTMLCGFLYSKEDDINFFLPAGNDWIMKHDIFWIKPEGIFYNFTY